MSDEGPEIVGTAPKIEGQRCDELVCEQYWYAGKVVGPANVIYLRCGTVWHRLTFDHGILFWSQQSDRPRPYRMPELNAEARLDDIGLRMSVAGRTLTSYTAKPITDGSEIEFTFEGNQRVVFRNVSDHTSIHS